ncbi:Zn(2)-C6 fungal-type domain-containing protein [Mycena kentingensis (nom. inval.)]|nr:Zn(2)-C6 fungal-type domain-containing protein [Mycena kentingensis (nom. inval.)]
MHISSTLNPLTRSAEDVPVLIVALDGKRKFLPRPTSFKALKRDIRSRFALEDDTGLVLSVSTLDICEGEDVELTEDVYELLASVLDVVKAAVADGSDDDAGIRTPAPTPPLHHERDEPHDEPHDNDENEAEVAEFLCTIKQESDDDEEVFAGSKYGGGDSEEEDDAPHARRALEKAFPAKKAAAKVKQEVEEKETKPLRLPKTPKQHKPKAESDEDASASTPKAKATPKAKLNRADTTSSTQSSSEASFKIYVRNAQGTRKLFKTRGSHTVQKIINSVAANLKIDAEGSSLKLYRIVEDEDDPELESRYECGLLQTMAEIGAEEFSEFVIYADGEEEED